MSLSNCLRKHSFQQFELIHRATSHGNMYSAVLVHAFLLLEVRLKLTCSETVKTKSLQTHAFLLQGSDIVTSPLSIRESLHSATNRGHSLAVRKRIFAAFLLFLTEKHISLRLPLKIIFGILTYFTFGTKLRSDPPSLSYSPLC